MSIRKTDHERTRTLDTASERGQSISLFVLLIMGALIMTTGLVIDGGQKVAATSRAESAAAGASRAAGNAAATQQLGGADPAECRGARREGLSCWPARGIKGTVSIANGVVTMTTSAAGANDLALDDRHRLGQRRGFGARQHRAHRSIPMIMQTRQPLGRTE